MDTVYDVYSVKTDAIYNLHAVLGHLQYSRIEKMIRKGIVNGYTFDVKLLKQLVNVKCDICMRAKITDASHSGHLNKADRPWRMLSMDVAGPMKQASIRGNKYQCAIMDTKSTFVWDEYMVHKDEVYSILSVFCEQEIVLLRGRDTSEFEIFLMSDLGEAHTHKIIQLCRKYGVVKQSTAGYTPQHNAFIERWFRTNGEMSTCQLLDKKLEEEYWEDSRRHATYLFNRIPPSRYTPGEPWLTPMQLQYPNRRTPDLTKLQSFGTTCWTHIKKARRPGKSDINPRGERGILVGYDDSQGPLLARIYFPANGIYELHDNGYVKYQTKEGTLFENDITNMNSNNTMTIHNNVDNKVVVNTNLNVLEKSRIGNNKAAVLPAKPVEYFLPLIGTRHVDPDNGLTYQVTEIKITPNRDIVAWRRRVVHGEMRDIAQGPFHVQDIYEYTNITLKHVDKTKEKRQYVDQTTCDVSSIPRVKGIDAQEVIDGSQDGEDVPIPSKTSKSHGSPNGVNIRNILNTKRARIKPAIVTATSMESRKETHEEYKHNKEGSTQGSHIGNLTTKSAKGKHKRYKVATHLACAIASDDQFACYTIDAMSETLTNANDNLPKNKLFQDDFEPPTRNIMLQCKQRVKWEGAD